MESTWTTHFNFHCSAHTITFGLSHSWTQLVSVHYIKQLKSNSHLNFWYCFGLSWHPNSHIFSIIWLVGISDIHVVMNVLQVSKEILFPTEPVSQFQQVLRHLAACVVWHGEVMCDWSAEQLAFQSHSDSGLWVTYHSIVSNPVARPVWQ